MKRFFALVLAAVLAASPHAYAGPAIPGPAQSTSTMVGCIYSPTGVTLTAANNQAACQLDSAGNLLVAGTISASLAGFTPNGAVASLSVTTASANVALPAGTVVLVTNTGTTNIAYIKLSVGAGTAATTDMALVAGATVGLTVGTNTYINAITSSSTTTLRLAGGTGLVSGYGGGGGSSGGGDASAANQTVVQGVIGAATAPTKMAVAGCVYNSTPLTVTNGQSAAAQCDANGFSKVYVTNNGVAIDATTSGQTPSTVACNALSATPTAYTTARTGPISCDLYGNVIVQPYSLPQNRIQGAITSAMTGTTSTSLLAAPGANLYNYIQGIYCKNSHSTQGTLVAVQDGSGGTTMFQVAAAPAFGGDNSPLPSPWKQTTANTALYVANVTSGASTTCYAVGFKAP